MISEHQTDATYPVVSAASILAKVRRDLRIDEIKREYGDFGSGYAHDPGTIRFLGNYLQGQQGVSADCEKVLEDPEKHRV